MIFNITYNSRKTEDQIKSLVGPSFSFLERIRMKGIGTSKMIIRTASSEILDLLSDTADTDYCHLEMRKKGIIVGFISKGRVYAWAIPYYKLVIYSQSGNLTIFDDTHKIDLKPAFNRTIDRKFVIKILEQKSLLHHN